MTEEITITIDDVIIRVPAGSTILEAARSVGVDIPTICYHDHTTSNGVCRTCVVEVEGGRTLTAACVAQVADELVVHTRSERVDRCRKTILEMLSSAVDLSQAPEIKNMMLEYDADDGRFPASLRREAALIDDNPMFVRDYNKCVLCWRCVQVCAEDAQYTYALNFSGRGFDTQITTFFDKPLPETSCVFCGQCVGVCPTDAIQPKREWLLEKGLSSAEISSAVQKKNSIKRKSK
jgi:NADH dehydrogenase/NADH:ubiquinone oxidoreductase subunit G